MHQSPLSFGENMPHTTAVRDVYTWATFGSTLKDLLGVTGSEEDDALEMQLAVATVQADQFMGNPFTNTEKYPNGLLIGDPLEIQKGIVFYVKTLRELEPRGFGVTSAKTDQLSEVYAVGTRIKGGDWSLDDVTRQVGSYWWPHKLDIF